MKAGPTLKRTVPLKRRRAAVTPPRDRMITLLDAAASGRKPAGPCVGCREALSGRCPECRLALDDFAVLFAATFAVQDAKTEDAARAAFTACVLGFIEMTAMPRSGSPTTPSQAPGDSVQKAGSCPSPGWAGTTSISLKREARARAVEEAARLIRLYPNLPLAPASSHNPLEVMITAGTEDEKRQEIDRIASVLGVTAGCLPGTRLYGVTHWIGEGVAYRAYARVSRTEDTSRRPLAAVGMAAC